MHLPPTLTINEATQLNQNEKIKTDDSIISQMYRNVLLLDTYVITYNQFNHIEYSFNLQSQWLQSATHQDFLQTLLANTQHILFDNKKLKSAIKLTFITNKIKKNKSHEAQLGTLKTQLSLKDIYQLLLPENYLFYEKDLICGDLRDNPSTQKPIPNYYQQLYYFTPLNFWLEQPVDINGIDIQFSNHEPSIEHELSHQKINHRPLLNKMRQRFIQRQQMVTLSYLNQQPVQPVILSSYRTVKEQASFTIQPTLKTSLPIKKFTWIGSATKLFQSDQQNSLTPQLKAPIWQKDLSEFTLQLEIYDQANKRYLSDTMTIEIKADPYLDTALKLYGEHKDKNGIEIYSLVSGQTTPIQCNWKLISHKTGRGKKFNHFYWQDEQKILKNPESKFPQINTHKPAGVYSITLVLSGITPSDSSNAAFTIPVIIHKHKNAQFLWDEAIPSNHTVYIQLTSGKSVKFKAQAKSQSHSVPKPTGKIHYQLLQLDPDPSERSIGEVDPDSGKITIRNKGQGKIIATQTADRNFYATSNHYIIKISDKKLPRLNWESIPNGTTLEHHYDALNSKPLIVKTNADLEGSIIYTSDTPEVAAINQQGYIHHKKPGTTVIRATLKPTAKNKESSIYFNLHILSAQHTDLAWETNLLTTDNLYYLYYPKTKTVKIKSRSRLSNKRIVYSVSTQKAGMASISNDGTVTLHYPASATVKATHLADNKYDKTVIFYQIITRTDTKSGLSWTPTVMNGLNLKKRWPADTFYTLKAHTHKDSTGNIVYEISDESTPDVATLTMSTPGQVQIHHKGSATITAISRSAPPFKEDRISYRLIIE